jgi:hypothetical protein
VELRKTGRDTYFRINARVIADGEDVSAVLILNVFTVLYDGGTKTKDWCAETTVERRPYRNSFPSHRPMNDSPNLVQLSFFILVLNEKERAVTHTLENLPRTLDSSRLIVWVGGFASVP